MKLLLLTILSICGTIVRALDCVEVFNATNFYHARGAKAGQFAKKGGYEQRALKKFKEQISAEYNFYQGIANGVAKWEHVIDDYQRENSNQLTMVQGSDEEVEEVARQDHRPVDACNQWITAQMDKCVKDMKKVDEEGCAFVCSAVAQSIQCEFFGARKDKNDCRIFDTKKYKKDCRLSQHPEEAKKFLATKGISCHNCAKGKANDD